MTPRRRGSGIRQRTLSTGVLALAFAWTGCSGSTQPDPTAASTSLSASTSALGPSETTSPATTPGGVRLGGLPEYPVEVTPDPSWRLSDISPGTMGFSGPDASR